MTLTIELDKDLAIEAFEIAAGVRRRAATKFKAGSAAYTELHQHAHFLEMAAKFLKNQPTPLETAIDKTKK